MKYIITALLTLSAFSQQFKTERANRAQKRYHDALVTARKRYAKDLTKAKGEATKAGRLDEAIRIRTIIEDLQPRLSPGKYFLSLKPTTGKRSIQKIIVTENKMTLNSLELKLIPDPRGFLLVCPEGNYIMLYTIKAHAPGWYVKYWNPVDLYKKNKPPTHIGMSVKL